MSDGQNTQSLITAEVEITGTIKSSGSVRIDGKLDGELTCSADAVIGKSAEIKGNLSVNSVVVEGKVDGNITAKDKIEMKSTARVNGDIVAKRLSVEDGVTFVGRSEVNPSGSAASTASTPASSSSSKDDTGDEKGGSSKGGLLGRR